MNNEPYVCPHGYPFRHCEDPFCVDFIKKREEDCDRFGHLPVKYTQRAHDPNDPPESTRYCIACKKELTC